MLNNIIASIMAFISSLGLGGSSPPGLPPLAPAPAPGAHAQAHNTITREQAENVALSHAGAPRGEVRWDTRELDWDGGTPEWNIEFHWRGFEYEYEINAWNSQVISFERDRDN